MDGTYNVKIRFTKDRTVKRISTNLFVTFLIPCTRFSDSAKHLSNALNSHRISEYAKKCVIESVCV